MRKRIAVTLLGALLVASFVVAAAQSSSTKGKTINIGWVGDKSGPTVGSQAPALHGLQAYFRMINESGGVNGDTINMIEKDDKFNPATELSLVKSLISDDNVPFITGIGNSSGFASVIPVLSAAKIPGLSNQGALKTGSYPFQPWFFEGNCNYADQGDVALGYEMAHLKLKDLKGVSVGVAGISAASGQEWNENLANHIKKLGGNAVVQSLPAVIVNADVQVQAFQDAKVAFVLMHSATSGGIAVLKSMAKYGLNVPISGSFGVTQAVVYQSSPYDSAKNFTGTNCITPPLYAKTDKGKLAYATGKKYGYPESEITQQNYALGWINGQIIVAALKAANGVYTGESIRKGLESIKNLDTGGLAPSISLGPKCHMAVQQVRPYNYSYSKDTMLPVGTYEQWAKVITNAYAAPGTCGKPRGATS